MKQHAGPLSIVIVAILFFTACEAPQVVHDDLAFDPAAIENIELPPEVIKVICGVAGGTILVGFVGWLLENYGEGVVAEYLSVRHAVGSDAYWRARAAFLRTSTMTRWTSLNQLY